MIHPFQSVASNSDGSLLFFVIKNSILVFSVKDSNDEFKLVGEWSDEADSTAIIKEKVTKEQQRQLAENTAKKLKANDGTALPQEHKEAKIPKPGQGAPPIYQYIRNVKLSRDGKWLFACTDSDKAIVMFEISAEDKNNCLRLAKRQRLPKRPNAITTTIDDKQLIVADKFGDLYSFGVNDDQPCVNPEPILGHVSLLTDVAIGLDSNGKQLVFTSDRDEHIRITHFPQSFIIDKWLFGHKEFISTMCLPVWAPELLFSAGGESSIFSWNWQTGELLDRFNIAELIQPFLTENHLAPDRFQNKEGNLIEYSVSKIVTFDSLPLIAFFIEATKAIFTCQINRDSGKIALKQVLEVPYNVVSLACAETTGELIATLDNQNSHDKNFVAFISMDVDKFHINQSKQQKFDDFINSRLSDNEIANIEQEGIYPLYHVASLRKRGEH